MFNKPVKVEINTNDATVDHNINVSTHTEIQAHTLIVRARKETIAVIAIALAAKTASEIAIHIAKTKIK